MEADGWDKERKAIIAAHREHARRAERLLSPEMRERSAALERADTREILTAHHADLADDPERLPTDFLRKLIGRKDPCPDEQT